MNKEEVFDIWAPEAASWSRWVKPLLFACMQSSPPSWLVTSDPIDLSWAPAAAPDVVLVIDLPGASGVHAGLELATKGFRPVPLYNAIPLPFYFPDTGAVDPAPCLVEVTYILAALWYGRVTLSQLTLPAEAPPAFLLDWDRDGGNRLSRPGVFDNRSVSFTTDFPSANFLQSHGVRRAIVVQPREAQPRTDLAHTLRRWQEAGITIELKRLDEPGGPVPCEVQKPSWFGWAWQRVLMASGFQRAKVGGFGAWVPEASSG